MADMTFKAKLLPSTDLSSDYTLGSSSKRWKIFGDLTGTLNGYYTASTDSPVLAVRANNVDVPLFQLGHATSATGAFSNHYRLVYKGTGSSPNNYLQLIANTSSTDTIAMQVNENGNVSFTNTVSASISGNAATATKLATARSLKTKLDSTTAVTFDGSADQNAIPVTGTLPIGNGGTGATTALAASYKLGYIYWNGVGTQLSNNDNLNDYNQSNNKLGTYYSSSSSQSATLSNPPFTSSGFKLLSLAGYGSTRGHQVAWGTSATPYLRTETGTAGSYTAWSKLVYIQNDSNNANIAIGSSSQPVYTNSDGKLIAATAYSDLLTNVSWTAGTTSGPILSITVGGTTKTATIPSASKTASGVVTTGAQQFVGRKGFGYLSRYGYSDSGTASRYVADTQCYNNAGTIVAEYWYDVGDATNITRGQWGIRAYSPQSTANTTTTGKYESYYLPNVTSGRTANADYNILTSKNAVTVAQGGTGATTAAGARANLAVPYMTTETYPALVPTDGTNNWIKVGTSNTSYGLLPSQGGGAGSGHNYLGTSSWYWKYAYIDEIYGHLNGTATSVAIPISFGTASMNGPILQYNSSYPKYGIWYNDAATDTMRFSASGNADTNAGADLCINGNGAGTVTIRGATILTTSNYSTTCDGRYVKKAGDTMTGHLTAPSTGCSWIQGQNAANAAFNIGDATTTNAYWPWMRQTNTASSKWFSFGTLGTCFYWIGSATSRTENGYDSAMIFNVSTGYLTGCSRVYGAVWNDYAEYRKNNPNEVQEPGRCVRELGDGSLALTIKRLERGCEIISDTFGFAIGQDEKNGYNTPIASNGRVLAYPYESVEEFADHIGWPVCSGPNGTVSIMTEEEEEKYPSRIIGTISEIPTYETWGTGNVKVNGRVWIRIK